MFEPLFVWLFRMAAVALSATQININLAINHDNELSVYLLNQQKTHDSIRLQSIPRQEITY